MAFVGLWERWRVAEDAELPQSLVGAAPGDTIETCAILMTGASASIPPVHHRLPAILPPEGFGPWLDNRAVEFKPASAVKLVLRPVWT